MLAGPLDAQLQIQLNVLGELTVSRPRPIHTSRSHRQASIIGQLMLPDAPKPSVRDEERDEEKKGGVVGWVACLAFSFLSCLSLPSRSDGQAPPGSGPVL